MAIFEAKEVVVQQGSEATHLGVVLSGTLAVSVVGDGGTHHPIGDRRTGATFCETALMTGEPLSAEIVAAERSEVLMIPVSLLRSTIVAEPGMIQQITKTVAERVKTVMANPAAAAALQPSADPYGLELKGEHADKILVINCGSSSLQIQLLQYRRPETRGARRRRAHRAGWHALETHRSGGRGKERPARRELSRGLRGDGRGVDREGLGRDGQHQ